MRGVLVALGFAGTAALAATAGTPQRYDFGTLLIEQPVARATPPGARTGVVYFVVENVSKNADRLVRASSPVAAHVVLHQMAVVDGMMRMRAVPSVEVLPGARLELSPDNGYHLMLLDLKQPLKLGEEFPLMLTFERAGTVRTVVLVEEMGATPTARRR
ncbi:MAG TPA: copper chaperone PCu(A)C [Casimicrobiaceae bacterium]|nr:copper chaperone PCu(A)C [Casimicrobiaceae bacterium]